jgi:hypothetical protein
VLNLKTRNARDRAEGMQGEGVEERAVRTKDCKPNREEAVEEGKQRTLSRGEQGKESAETRVQRRSATSDAM